MIASSPGDTFEVLDYIVALPVNHLNAVIDGLDHFYSIEVPPELSASGPYNEV
ncbi:hypothetical protein JXQ70_07055 [bacterium]|nr:hypothetical protein [bacterium]